MKRNLERVMAAMLLILVSLCAINTGNLKRIMAVTSNATENNSSDEATKKITTVILDAGHGGNDPGKVGVNGILEKDVNLSIVGILKEKLLDAGIKVVVTRTSDEGLHDEGASNKKLSDMINRSKIINETENSICISIHQNSYGAESVHGAQVFFYSDSKEGEMYANTIQKYLIDMVDTKNTRKAKANKDYYLLLNTNCITLIVECGFLSNYNEAEKLSTYEYQEKIATAIASALVSRLK